MDTKKIELLALSGQRVVIDAGEVAAFHEHQVGSSHTTIILKGGKELAVQLRYDTFKKFFEPIITQVA